MGEVLGRDVELKLAARLLRSVSADPRFVLLSGAQGIGKTTVWRAVLARAEAEGFRILSARPVGSEATLAFAAVADLLRDGVDEALLELPPPQRTALEAALLRADPPGTPDPRAVAFGFTSTLRALSRAGPVLVGVDDVQWLDAPSARVLEFALRRLEGVPVAAVLTWRSDGADPGASTPLDLRGGLPEDRVHHVPIGPLGPGILRRIVRSRLDVRLPQWVLAEIHEASGGNPLLALELARALVRRGIPPRAGEPLPVPQQLSELVTERLDVVSPELRETLLLVAASPQPGLASIGRAVGDPARLRADVDRAVAADLLEVSGDRLGFTNPLLGTVLYAGTPAADRRRVHRMLADVAEDPEERARHLAMAVEGPDEDVAQVLESAAQRARSQGAPDAAAQLAEMALALTPPDGLEARVRRTSSAGRYAFESAHVERAEELLQEAAATASTGPTRAEALLYLSRVHYHRRDARSALALAEEALRDARGDPSLQASINLELAAAAEQSGDHRTATARARQAVRLAERSGDRTITAESLSVSGFYAFLSGKGIPTAQLVRAKELAGGGPPVRPLRSPGFYEACMLMWSDDLARARRRLRELERGAREAGDEGTLSILLFLLAQLESWAGDLSQAARLAEESHALAEWTGQRAYLIMALYAEALVAGLRGDVDRAIGFGEESLRLAEQAGAVPGQEFARSVLGSIELSKGDARAVDRWLSPLVEALPDRGPVEPGSLRFLPDAIEASIALGTVERAEPLLGRFEADARRLRRGWALGSAARCRGLVLAARRRLDEALDAFEEALEHQRALGQPLETGRTHLARGRALRRAKKWAAARESLGRSLQVFEVLGAPVWAATARSELARIGGRTPYLSALTETEERVAELVATGLTNREVAGRLFLSVSTVESNLRRAYRKLGVRSRVELSRSLPPSGARPRS